jgi:YlmC/YmxH family sporulation protein
MEASFLELKAKQVINTVDGKCLGHITDIVFDVVCAKALGFVVPQPNQGFWGMFKSGKDIFIPFDCVCKIGVDVILVELYIGDGEFKNNKHNKNPKDCGKDKCITLNREEKNSN